MKLFEDRWFNSDSNKFASPIYIVVFQSARDWPCKVESSYTGSTRIQTCFCFSHLFFQTVSYLFVFGTFCCNFCGLCHLFGIVCICFIFFPNLVFV
jgi:hypothetical protein